MILRRILATTASSVFVVGALASCGGGTGETPNTNAAPPTAANNTQQSAAPQKATFLILQGDTVRSPEGLTDDQKPLLSCVQLSRFPQGSRIVWRFRVIDPTTNTALDDKALKSFDLVLPDGKTVAFKYGGHGGTKPNYAEYFWTAGFSIPADYPTGLFNYQVKAVSLEGATGTFEQMKVPAAQLTVVKAG